VEAVEPSTRLHGAVTPGDDNRERQSCLIAYDIMLVVRAT
jgi:hypothetical protein